MWRDPGKRSRSIEALRQRAFASRRGVSMNVLVRFPRATGAERKNFHLPRLPHQFLHLAILHTSCCQGGYASVHSEELQRKNHRIGRERPLFFGFQPPNAHWGRSRPLLRRVECAPVVSLKFAIGNLYKIPGEFSSEKSLCLVEVL